MDSKLNEQESDIDKSIICKEIAVEKEKKYDSQIRFINVTDENIRLFKMKCLSIFPMNYSEKMYKEIANHSMNDPLELTKLVVYQTNDMFSQESERAEVCIGVICCWLLDRHQGYNITTSQFMRKIPDSEDPHQNHSNENAITQPKRLYIMTLGCLPTYRNRGIGTYMMRYILDKINSAENHICSIFLHVKIDNEEAISFYKKFGFAIVDTVQNYYRRLNPPAAYILEKQLVTE